MIPVLNRLIRDGAVSVAQKSAFTLLKLSVVSIQLGDFDAESFDQCRVLCAEDGIGTEGIEDGLFLPDVQIDLIELDLQVICYPLEQVPIEGALLTWSLHHAV
jgi:hypothetical protein